MAKKPNNTEDGFIVLSLQGGREDEMTLYPSVSTAYNADDEEVFAKYKTVTKDAAIQHIREMDEDERKSAAIINIKDMIRVTSGHRNRCGLPRNCTSVGIGNRMRGKLYFEACYIIDAKDSREFDKMERQMRGHLRNGVVLSRNSGGAADARLSKIMVVGADYPANYIERKPRKQKGTCHVSRR